MILPERSFGIMYGPVKTTCCPYVEVFPLSNFCAYSFGTGAVPGSVSALAVVRTPTGFVVLITSVVGFGAWMPEIPLALPSVNALTPTMSP